MEHLRARRTVRRSKHASQKRKGNGQIKNAVSIIERPASVEDRAVPGHWEGDLIGGSKNSYVATLVERHSRYVMLVKVANKDTESVITALIKSAQKLPRELYKSLTWDRGKELADHPRFTLATDVDVYFCDPQSPLSSLQAATAAQCVAAWVKREHQPAFEAVLAARNGSISPFPSKTQRNCKATQRTASQDLAISDASREVRRVCCVDQLRSPSIVRLAPRDASIMATFGKRLALVARSTMGE